MSQTLTNEVTKTKSNNGLPSTTVDYLNVMTLVHNDLVKIVLSKALAVTIDKIGDAAGSKTVDELVNVVYREEFFVCVSNAMVKLSHYYQLRTEDVIKKKRNR